MPSRQSGPFAAELFTKFCFPSYVLHQHAYYVNRETVWLTIRVNQHSWRAELILPIFEISRRYYLVWGEEGIYSSGTEITEVSDTSRAPTAYAARYHTRVFPANSR